VDPEVQVIDKITERRHEMLHGTSMFPRLELAVGRLETNPMMKTNLMVVLVKT